MKIIYLLAFLLTANFAGFAQDTAKISTPNPKMKIQIVEVACGECKLGLEGESCDLAIRINGKSYFVEGTDIDDHGDAHNEEGFCNAISKAEVQGKIVGDKFVATYFKVIKEKKLVE
jgi:hypothetical protein